MYALFRTVLGMPLPSSPPPVRAAQPPVEASFKKKPIAKSAKSKPVKPQE